MAEIPDLRWYARVSTEQRSPIHCPFATVEACPRYYQSLSLLGEAGSTKIAPAEDSRLLAKWRGSDLWPKTAEQNTSLVGSTGRPHQFAKFCPEITFERFGYFATYLARYCDEIDVGIAHEQLARESAPTNDPRWSWSSIEPQHYTECPIYSVLAHRASAPTQSPAQPPWWKEHLAKIVVGVVVAAASAMLIKLFA